MRATDEYVSEGPGRRAVDWLFGFDFFISYAHDDGKIYPQRLKQRLEQAGFRAFLDQTEYVPGTNLSRETGRQVRKSRSIIVIGRERALSSKWVKREVEIALRHGKDPVIIDINGAVAAAPTGGQGIVDIARQQDWLRLEERFADADGAPSDRTVSELIRSFRHVRQETRRSRVLALTAAVFAVLAVAAAWQSIVAVNRTIEVAEERLRLIAGQAEQLAQVGNGTAAMLVALEGILQRRSFVERVIDRLSRTTRESEARTRAYAALYSGLYARREIHVFPLSAEPLTTLAALPSTRRVAVGTLSGQILVIEPGVGVQWQATTGHKIIELTARPDGGRLISVDASGAVLQWDAKTGAAVGIPMPLEKPVIRAAYDASGQRILALQERGPVVVLDAESGQRTLTLPHDTTVNDGRFSPDGKYIATASEDGVIRLWSTSEGSEPRKLTGHEKPVLAIQFSADGNKLISGAKDKLAFIWELASDRKVALRGHADDVTGVAFSPDGNRALTRSDDGTARLWSADATSIGWKIGAAMRHDSKLTVADFSADGREILTAAIDNVARLWNGETSEIKVELRGHFNWRKDRMVATYDSDGAHVVTAGWEGTARIWKVAAGAEVIVLAPHHEEVLNAIFSPDGSRIATGDWSGQAKIWNVENGRLERSLETGDALVWGLAFSPDGKRLAVATEAQGIRKGTLSVWDLSGSGPPQQSTVDRGLRTVVFSPDGRKLVFGGYSGNGYVVDSSNLVGISSPLRHDGWLQTAAFSPDSTELVTGSRDRHIRVWRTSDWSLWHQLPKQNDRVMGISFGHDGSRFVSSSPDGQVAIWRRAETGYVKWRDLIVPESEKSEIWSASFSPDDKWVLTSSFDKTARIWVPRDRSVETIAVLRGHTHWVRTAAFSSDGRRVVTASSDRTARVWPVFPNRAEFIRHVLSNLPRCLHGNERRQLGLDPAPPTWCITGSAENEPDASRWMPKWPFTSPTWRLWLSQGSGWWQQGRTLPQNED
jgi:WD40 repeat protein